MIELNKYTQVIKGFVNSSISRFHEENDKPSSIGIYCCSWAGWVTTNFNIHKSIVETENNCPDFEFVEFDFLDLEEWQNEYETDNPKYKLDGEIMVHNHDLGDEVLNKMIFEYLKPIVLDLKNKYESVFLLQMLDSDMAEKYECKRK